MMLAIFPTMFLALLAHLLLRLFVGGSLLYLGYRHLFRERTGLRMVLKKRWPNFGGFFVWYLSFIEITLGLLFIVGFVTQIAALVAIVFSLKMLLFRKRFLHASIPPAIYYTLLIGASLSLLITGAGALAVDLPI